jgi:DNA replication protein DnaC
LDDHGDLHRLCADIAHLDPTKSLATFDFSVVPMVSKAHVMALATGDSWLEKGATILLFGPPGGGKSHLGSIPKPCRIRRWRRNGDAVYR